MHEDKISTRRWGQERRLEFIDFSAYQELAPSNMVYDRTERAYVATESFKAIMVNPEPYQYLNELLWRESNLLSSSESFVSTPPPIETLPHPYRSVSTESLKVLLKAIRNTSAVEISYQSMNKPEPESRWVCPRTFAFDGFRWHVRCYCLKSGAYKDFVVGRILTIFDVQPLSESLPPDDDWETFVRVILAPNPNYHDALRIAIEKDFGMSDGKAEVILRKALLYYFKKRLHLSEPGAIVSEDQQIVMLSANPV